MTLLAYARNLDRSGRRRLRVAKAEERHTHQRRGVEHHVAAAATQSGMRQLAQLAVAGREPAVQFFRMSFVC
jgi:hypothetical protein